jgi:hypothetical protein
MRRCKVISALRFATMRYAKRRGVRGMQLNGLSVALALPLRWAALNCATLFL